MCTSRDRLGDAEAASDAGTQYGLGVERIRQAEARADAAIPARCDAARAFAARTETGELQRTGEVFGPWVGLLHVEIAPLVGLLHRRQRELIADTVVQGQLRCQLQIVLGIPGMAPPLLADKAIVLGAAGKALAEQERGETIAAAGV